MFCFVFQVWQWQDITFHPLNLGLSLIFLCFGLEEKVFKQWLQAKCKSLWASRNCSYMTCLHTFVAACARTWLCPEVLFFIFSRAMKSQSRTLRLSMKPTKPLQHHDNVVEITLKGNNQRRPSAWHRMTEYLWRMWMGVCGNAAFSDVLVTGHSNSNHYLFTEHHV